MSSRFAVNTLDLPEGARELGLPDDPRVLVFAATLAGPGAGETRPATTLYD